MRFAVFLLGVVTLAANVRAQSAVCSSAPAIRAELQKAASPPVANAADFDQNMFPFRALRERYPDDLFVHQSYQDAVQRFGIEGHLRTLVEEYQGLLSQHPDDLKYRYLYIRSLIGRGTPGAVQGLKEILAETPDFAPAHGALAEIYATEAFRDAEGEKIERERFLGLCPGASLTQRPSPLPAPTALLDQAEHILGKGNASQAMRLAQQGIQDEEWRLQRARPFDWYSVDYKRHLQRDVQVEYWRLWSIQVGCYRKLGQEEKAAQTLAMMEQRAAQFRKSADPVYWEALVTLARLYAEENEKERASEKLASLQQLLASRPDAAHASQFEDLRRLIESAGK
jgi:hypothetical protein